MKKLFAMIVVVCTVWMIAGCGNESVSNKVGTGDTAAKADASPVTIRVFNSLGVNDQDFATIFADPVKKKYPNITLEDVLPGKGSNIADLVASGDIPDILLKENGQLLNYKEMGLPDDIAPLVKKQNVDLGRFDPVMLDSAKSGGVLYGLPFAVNFTALYYNKDIFDKFAASYPKDGMTWDEVLELAKKLTRTDGGVNYHGLDPTNINLLSFPFAVTYIDTKTGKASVNNEQWKTIFTLAKNIYSIPGNGDLGHGGPGPASNSFLKDKNVAMLTAVNILNFLEKSDDVNWDIAQFPSYREKPGVSGKVDAHLMMIAKTSKHKDQSMQVMQVVTSDEVQLEMVRKTLRVSPLANKEMQSQFGAESPYLKGRNLQGIFKGKVVAAPEYSPYTGKAQTIATNNFYSDFLPANGTM